MFIIKINGDDTPYRFSSVMPFTSQHGYNAIKIIGNTMPETDKGFKIYDEDDNVISDYSDYIYLYKEDSYCVEKDNIELPGFVENPIGPSSIDILNRRINRLNTKVTKITPYIMSKEVGIDETECEFDYVKTGNISAWYENNNETVSCSFEIVDDKIKVTFEPLTDVATVYVSIQ